MPVEFIEHVIIGDASTLEPYYSQLQPPGTVVEVAVWGDSKTGTGIAGTSFSKPGVIGVSTVPPGVFGLGNNIGVMGFANNGGVGVHGDSYTGDGINGFTAAVDDTTNGVMGLAFSGTGVYGSSENGGTGVYGTTEAGGDAVAGETDDATATAGRFSNVNISTTQKGRLGVESTRLVVNRYTAGLFMGNVNVYGDFYVSGAKGFRIDHPDDPANMFLAHAAVEAPELKTFYDGLESISSNGEVVVKLPSYFNSLNKSFRYQVTAIGRPSPGLYIKDEIQGNSFTIAGGTPGAKVSWQVTAIRQDNAANATKFKPEIKKTAKEQGKYVTPEFFSYSSKEEAENSFLNPEVKNAAKRKVIADRIRKRRANDKNITLNIRKNNK